MSRALSKTARILVIFGAWFFAVVTGLYAAAAGVCRLIFTDSNNVFWVTYVDGVRYEAIGVNYHTGAEHLLAGVQALFVLACLILSTRRRLVLRRTGHVGLILWAGLWLANMIRLLFIDGVWITVITTAVIAALFTCTVLRALICWTPRSA